MTPPNASKVIVFFGSDVPGDQGLEHLADVSARGCSLLALDSSAAAQATRAGLPYTLPDDWIPPEALASALEAAGRAEREWFLPAEDAFTVDGLCLPYLDIENMGWFWRDAMVSIQLARAFRRADVEAVNVFGRLFRRSAVGCAPSDVLPTILLSELQERLHVSINSRALKEEIAAPLIQRGLTRVLGPKNRRPALEPTPVEDLPRGGVVLVLSAADAPGLMHTAEQLVERFPGRAAVIVCDPLGADSSLQQLRERVPLAYGPPSPRSGLVSSLPTSLLPKVDRTLAGRFLEGYSTVLRESEGKPWHMVLEDCDFHFRFYCAYRWPHLRRNVIRGWEDTWDRLLPRAVIVTSRPDAPFQFAAATAGSRGVPTFALLGADEPARPRRIALRADHVLIDAPLCRSFLKQDDEPEARLTGYRSASAAKRPRREPVRSKRSRKTPRILAFIEPIVEGPNVSAGFSIKARIRGVQALLNARRDMSVSVDFVALPHPNPPDLEILEAAGADGLLTLLPSETPLDTAIDDSDLAVTVNHLGPALIPCFRRGLPVILLLSRGGPSYHGMDDRYAGLQKGCLTAGSPDEFRRAVERFFTDPDFEETARSRTREFAARELDGSSYPTLPELIERLT